MPTFGMLTGNPLIPLVNELIFFTISISIVFTRCYLRRKLNICGYEFIIPPLSLIARAAHSFQMTTADFIFLKSARISTTNLASLALLELT